MADIFGTEESVFFIGGTDTKAGHANPGGCTKAWFDANFTQLTDIMAGNGTPLIADTDATLAEYDTNKKITRSSGDFTGIEAGMVAYVSDGGTDITTGRYKITTVAGDKSYIYIDGLVCSGNSAGDVVINIGGAFDSLTAPLADGDVDATSYSVDVYTNKAETLAARVDVVAQGGAGSNTWLRLIGFKDAPGDMGFGKTYCQSPMDVEKDGSVDTSKCVDIDGDGLNSDLFNVVNLENIEFRNLYFHGTNKASGNDCFRVYGSSNKNHLWIDCKFDTAHTAIYGYYTDNCSVIRCWFGSDFVDHTIDTPDDSWLFLDNVINAVSGKHGVSGLGDTCIFIGNIFVGGLAGLYSSEVNTLVVVINNTFYNQTSYSIYLADDASVIEFNNILVVNDNSGRALHLAKLSTLPSVVFMDYSVFWSVDNNPIAAPWYDADNARDITPENSQVIDPKLTDPANGDFSLRPDSPCLNAGHAAHNGFVSAGAWQRKTMLPAEFY